VIVAIDVVLTVVGPQIVPFAPQQANPGNILQPPNRVNLFGTDQSGFDIFSRVLAAPQIDITIAVVSTLLSFAVGVVLGVLAGQADGAGRVRSAAAELLMRTMDVLQAFPVFILAMALVAAMGASPENLIVAVAFVSTPIFLRLARSEVLAIRQKAYIEAGVISGVSDLRIAFRHLLPNALSSALVQASVQIGWAILLTAGLSFVGAGVRVPTAEWGLMISTGARNMITGEWWIVFFPGIALGITVLGFALLGDGLRIYLDPTRRR
jgi:peptide/nickel transport system permease protein